jgi:trimeric autotransporter adhesin
MSEVKVNKISPRSGTTVTLGDNGDTISIPSGVTLDASSGGLAGTLTTAAQPNITSVGTLTSFTSTGIDDNATSTAITIDSSGSVGIGTSSPSAELHISKSADAGNAEFLIENSFATAGSTDEIVQIQGRFGGFDASYIITGKEADFTTSGNRSSFMSFWTRGAGTLAEAMRINSSGNVGIGTSSPGTALQVEKDWVSDYGSINISHSTDSLGGLGIRCNNVFKAALIYKGGTSGALLDLGTYAAEPILFRTNNAERMRIDSSGNVGIGTTSPTPPTAYGGLHINSQYPVLKLSSTTSGTGVADGFTVRINSTDDAQLWHYENKNMSFATNNAERMRIDSTGNVGIGTTTPEALLHVQKNANGAIGIKIENYYGANASAYLYLTTPNVAATGESSAYLSKSNTGGGLTIGNPETDSGSYTRFVQGSSERMRITSAGVVGIGAVPPSGTSSSSYSQLQVGNSFVSDSEGTNSSFQLLQNAYVGSGNNNYAVVGSGASHSNRIMMTSGVISFARAYPVTADSQITYNESMRIDSSGNVGIGTSSPTARLSVADSKTGTEASPHLVIVGNGYTGNHWLDTSAYYIGQNSNARLLRIYSGSNEAVGVELGVGATSFGTYSDERLKKDITDLTNGLNKILALRPVNFKYKSDADDYRNRIGIIAQSIVGQVDEALDETKITADDETQYYNVRYQDLIPVLVKGIQEQQTQIQELEARITALENA